MRPVLSPASPRLWRDPQTLQLGQHGGRAVVLAGLDPSARAVLALLDGTRDLAAVEAAAVRAGCPAERARELLDLLGSAGLVVDAAQRWPARLDTAERDRLAGDVSSLCLLHAGDGLAVLRRRDAACVLVLGAGRVGAPLAALLSAAGIGTVDVRDEGVVRAGDLAVGGLQPDDLGRRRGDAARGRLPGTTTSSRRPGRPDVAVLAPVAELDPLDTAALLHDGVPHLLAEVRDTVGVVGPLVLPGRSPCLHCLDLTRCDLDPDWPTLAVQLSGTRRGQRACDAALAAAVAAQAALQVLALVDGDVPASVGGSLELALPDWRWRRRSWAVHDACTCRWPLAG